MTEPYSCFCVTFIFYISALTLTRAFVYNVNKIAVEMLVIIFVLENVFKIYGILLIVFIITHRLFNIVLQY